MKNELVDINGKSSITRKLLSKYIKHILIFDALVVFFAIALNRDIGENTSFIIVSINGIFFGTSYAKMGVEFLGRKK